MIDSSTAKFLELTHNVRNPSNVEHTLFGILNATKTIPGERLLRAEILQPPCDADTIISRQDCVAELTRNEEMFTRLEELLSRFLDLEHLIALCIQLPKVENVRATEQKRSLHILYSSTQSYSQQCVSFC